MYSTRSNFAHDLPSQCVAALKRHLTDAFKVAAIRVVNCYNASSALAVPAAWI